MKEIFKSFDKKLILRIFIVVLIGVISSAVAFNFMHKNSGTGTQKRVNFLIIGNDTMNGHSDTIMIVSCDPMKKNTKIVSIPPNTATSLNGTKTTLSTIYSASGIHTLIDKVTEIVPVPIHNHIVMDYRAFRSLVDELGGIKIDVPYDMKYYDSKQNYTIDLNKGTQILDGKSAEMFVRYNPEDADHTQKREENQRTFFKELIQQKMTSDFISSIPDVYSKVAPYTTTDITLVDLDNFSMMLSALSDASTETKSISGVYEIYSNTVFFVADYEKNINIIDE